MTGTKLLLILAGWALAGLAAAAAQESGAMYGTLQSALESNRTNQSSTWVNPDGGGAAAVTPVRTFQNAQGLPCREFRQTIVIGGREEQGYGTACRQPDGTWRIVSAEPEKATSVERRTTIYVREAGWPYYYDPYRAYYAPWGYGYPYWYPFSLSLNLGYWYHDGKHRHGGHDGWYRGGGYHGGRDGGKWDRGGSRGGGGRGGGHGGSRR